MTEPIQPQYLLLTLEQYNKIAEYFSTVGNSIVRNTDLISELPTHQDLKDLIVQTLRPCLTEMRKAATDKMDSIEYSTKDKLSWQFIFQKVQPKFPPELSYTFVCIKSHKGVDFALGFGRRV